MPEENKCFLLFFFSLCVAGNLASIRCCMGKKPSSSLSRGFLRDNSRREDLILREEKKVSSREKDGNQLLLTSALSVLEVTFHFDFYRNIIKDLK